MRAVEYRKARARKARARKAPPPSEPKTNLNDALIDATGAASLSVVELTGLLLWGSGAQR